MNIKITSLAVLIIAAVLFGCGKKENQSTNNKNDKQTTEQKSGDNQTLQVSGNDKSVEVQCSGMTCTGCESTIKSKVKKVDGVKDVIADHKTNVVKASYDPGKTNPDAIKEAITAAGYKVESVK